MARKRQRIVDKPEGPILTPAFRPLNPEQRHAKRLCDTSTITFLSGPAGCSKTFCAVASAVDAFIQGRVDGIIITRPAIEACGERMGYLPGSSEEKLGVYVSPIMDAIKKYCEGSPFFLEIKQKTRIIPLAYLRGRTFENHACILDEAQNASADQIKMFLTRIGEGSNMILAGDTEQSDIHKCVLHDVARKLSHIHGIGWHNFTEQAIVRHPIIGEVLRCL